MLIKKHYRCDVYCESADGEILRRSERVPLSLCGCEKKHKNKKQTIGCLESNWGTACENEARYAWGQQDRGEVW